MAATRNPELPKTGRYLTLETLIARRILILDGAMGTMIQRHRFVEADFRGGRFADHPVNLRGNNDLLSLTRPDAILDIHRQYLAAGADIVSSNTFSANAVSQADYGLAPLAREIARAGAALARSACDEAEARDPTRPRFVAGSIGPTSKTLSMSPDVNDPGLRAISFDALSDAYADCIRGLLDGGADILLIETVFDALNAKAAIWAAWRVFDERGERYPVMLSGTIADASGRTLTGQTARAFLYSVEHARPLSVGLNCALGAGSLAGHVAEIARHARCAVSVHPNAGLPDESGAYNESPEYMADVILRAARAPGAGTVPGVGLNIAGGCCGTTPDHIRALARALDGAPPRAFAGLKDRITHLSGLEAFDLGPDSLFFNVGERTNVAGSRKFARLIREGARSEAVDIARDQVEAGAQAIDVNMDDALLDSTKEMAAFLDLAATEPDIARVPVMVDSSNWDTALAGLKRLQGKGILNSISLKEGEDVFLERAVTASRLGAAVVVMAFDETGQADTLERKTAICERAYRLLVDAAGFRPDDIILDPNIFAVGTGLDEHARYAIDYIEAARFVKERLPGARVSGGVSNVSFAFRGNDALRSAIHTVFLYHAVRAGMDIGIVNPAQTISYEDIPADLRDRIEDLLLARRPDATERLLEVAGSVEAAESRQAGDAWRALPADERVRHALRSGVVSHIAEDVEAVRISLPRAIDVIEGPLMEGMNIVGRLFGEGKMFLPQVVKSARVMQAAVRALLPHIEREKSGGGADAAGAAGASGRGTVVLATVKGDVHDIGKNIVSVVLSCNNYRVVDLGVMVPAERILRAAEEEGADAIGLSGLITPSLEEMTQVAARMRERGMRIPLLIGGATTNPLHTAIAIAPAYDGPVAHVADASLAPVVLEKLLNPARSAAFAAELAASQAEARAKREARNSGFSYVPLAQARARPFTWEDAGYQPPMPLLKGPAAVRYSIGELERFIDWTYFFLAWEMKGRYPEILDDPERGEQARALLADAKAELARMRAERSPEARGVAGIFPAARDGDDILIYASESRDAVRACVPALRQQRMKADGSPYLCHADYLQPAPASGGKPDWIGAFAVTVADSSTVAATRAAADATVADAADRDSYRSIMRKILADRLAEAAAERLHLDIRTRYWGYAAESDAKPEDLLAGRYRGIRPAPGYPPCPDHREKRVIFDLLDAPGRIGAALTESCMMMPAASVSGWYFSHPGARYFAVGKIGRDQALDFAARRGDTIAETERWLATELNYERGRAEGA